MAGIGNTVDTDLVGELVEVYRRLTVMNDVIARGRVRAVTTSQAGELRLWIEVVAGVETASVRARGEIGEIIVCTVSLDGNYEPTVLRLIKEPG